MPLYGPPPPCPCPPQTADIPNSLHHRVLSTTRPVLRPPGVFRVQTRLSPAQLGVRAYINSITQLRLNCLSAMAQTPAIANFFEVRPPPPSLTTLTAATTTVLTHTRIHVHTHRVMYRK